MADIFVSYTSADRDWAHWIAGELQALGHLPYIHEWEIKSGDDIYGWMERRFEATDHALCVVSDEYLKAPYSIIERNAALWRAARRPGFVLLVVVKPCRLPALSSQLRHCELFGIPEDAARLRLRDFLAAPVHPGPAVFPERVSAVSNVPVHVPAHFMGRDEPLAAIQAALGRYEGRVAITALHGLRGVGKTTLAAAYAERHRGDYRATWWIRAQTEPTMRADLVALGVRLGWVGAEEKEEPALAAVMERLRHEGEGILLIFDNAIDARRLTPYLPYGGAARVLATSNAHAWRGVAEPVEIRVWLKAVGADYLIARTNRTAEREDAEALSEALGGLPLAHEQAAAYCERLEITLAKYGRRFAATPAQLLDAQRDAPAEYHDGLTVAKTFGLAIEEAGKLHPAAEPLIMYAALLAPEPIPLFLFREGREALGKPLASLLAEDELDEAVAALRAFALVDRETIADEREPAETTDTIRLHRLVREVAAVRPPVKARDDARRALVAALTAVYPVDVFNDPRTWPRARRLDAFALALVGGGAGVPEGVEEPAGLLLNGLASYRREALGAYAQARPLFERALAIHETALGPQHPNIATFKSNLASVLQQMSQYAEAERLFREALKISETVFGAEHPNTATFSNNLALLLRDMGQHAKAEPLYQRALEIREKVLDAEHPSIATNLNNLALLLRDMGQYAKAEPLYQRALEIREKVLDAEHPSIAISLNNLAGLYRAQDRHAEAEPLYQRALEIRKKVLGAEHPDTAISFINLALLYKDQGQHAKAEPLFQHALPSVCKVTPFYKRTLEIREKMRGAEHPDTARARNDLERSWVTPGCP